MKNLPLFFVFLWIASACDFPDEDRCSSPYQWVEAEGACVIPIDTDVSDLVDTTPVPEGLGADCWTDLDCSIFAPAGPLHCLLNPTDPTEIGMCTFTDCEYEDCGGDFQCCDCEDSTSLVRLSNGSFVFCTVPEPVSILTSVGCTCR